MGSLSNIEQDCVERAAAAPMLDQVLTWAAVNSGSRNLTGLEAMAQLLGDAFSPLPGDIALVEPAPVDAIDERGAQLAIAQGRNLHLRVRPDAPVHLLLTGHMDTVFDADHPSRHQLAR